MALSSGRVEFGGFSIKSFLLTAIVIGLILALFFIPEIVNFQKSLRGGGSAASRSSDQDDTLVPAEPHEKVQLVKGDLEQSPLERISGMMNTGYIEQLKAKKLANSGPGGQTPVSGASWDVIKSKQSIDALRASRKEAESLAKKYNNTNSAARYALFNFINGIDMVLQSGERDMSAVEAIRYVNFLHAAALHATETSGDRNDYNRIASLNLGPAFSKAAALGMGPGVSGFNPRLTLTDIVVRKSPGRKGRWDEERPVTVSMKGFAIGPDIKQGILYVNGSQVKKVNFRKPNSLGHREFRVGRMNARGVYTFRVYSKNGPVYQKSYAFYPRVRKFPWLRNGQFEIPFDGDRDNRLDRFFTYNTGHILGASGGGFFSGEFEKF